MGTWEVLRFESADDSGFSLTVDEQAVFVTVSACPEDVNDDILKFERLTVCGLHCFPESVFLFLC